MERKQEISKSLSILVEAVTEMLENLKTNQVSMYVVLAKDALRLLEQLMVECQNKEEFYYSKLYKILYNAFISQKRILSYLMEDLYKAEHKTEFEFLPLLRWAYAEFYRHALVEGNKELEDKWNETDGDVLCENWYIKESKKTGNYKYDVSINVIAYNKLEYTKLCVESVLKNLPTSYSYELILLNHGSSDGTKEYFESVNPNKQIDLEMNGGGSEIITYIAEGKFILSISNDVIMTPSSIENMVKAFMENPEYGYGVPMTSAISNLQTPQDAMGKNILYSSLQEMIEITKEYNVYDIYKHEQRFRLCNPLTIMPNELHMLYCRKYLETGSNCLMFPDDLLSLFVRRMGYKNILLKDVYCHHYGSVTLKEEQKRIDYEKGRKIFLEKMGIDPWGNGICWNMQLFEVLDCSNSKARKVLGINCGLGSNSLKIKEEIKEHTHNLVHLTNITVNEKYYPDIKALSDEAYFCGNWDEISVVLDGQCYDYIILEQERNVSIDKNLLNLLYGKLMAYGKLIVFILDDNLSMIEWIKEEYALVTQTDLYEVWKEVGEEFSGTEYGRYYIISK